MYYNTTGYSNPDLEMFTEKAKTQDQKLKQLINNSGSLKNHPFTCRQIWEIYACLHPNVPYSSIVRAVNTLKNQGFIVETGKKIKGMYGRKVLELKKA